MSFVTEKCYTASTACAVAEVVPSTLRAWRNNNGLLADPNRKGWNRFSLADICVIRLVSALTKAGFQADLACSHAKYVGLSMRVILEGRNFSRFVWFSGDRAIYGDEKMTLAEYIDSTEGLIEASVFIDLMSIINHVVSSINHLKPETIMSEAEVEKMVAGVFAEVMRPTD